MPYVLGVDAGNTKTVALVARLDGTIVGAGRDGCGDIYATSADDALAAVEHAVEHALTEGGIRADKPIVGCFSMAGADWPEDFGFLQNAMEHRGFGRRVIVVNDAVGALRAGSPDGTGVAVVCGTGVATAARTPDGRTWHSSWWQEPGGGRELGRRALRAVYRAELGIDPPTGLTEGVLTFFGLCRVEEVLHRLTAREKKGAVDAGRLARVLLDTAEEGDPTARSIVREHGAALGDYALAAARRVGIEAMPFALVLVGGVFRHPSRLHAESVVNRVREGAHGAFLVNSRFEPCLGALFLALESAGIPRDESLRRRLVDSSPPFALFET